MCTLAAIASAVIPTNIGIASTPMITRVAAALRLLGCSKRGRRSRPPPRRSAPCSRREGAQDQETQRPPARGLREADRALSAVRPWPSATLQKPTAEQHRPHHEGVRGYRERAARLLDAAEVDDGQEGRSERERTALSASAGTALVIAATPATTDTATVRT